MVKKRGSQKELYKKVNLKKQASSVREAVVTVYRSGNSNVITIPADFPYKEGDVFIVKGKGNELHLRKISSVEDETKAMKKKLRQLDRLIGTHRNPRFKNMDIDELEEFLEGVYE